MLRERWNDKAETPRPVAKSYSRLRDAKIARKRDFNTRQQQRFREIEIALKFSGTHVSEGTILYT